MTDGASRTVAAFIVLAFVAGFVAAIYALGWQHSQRYNEGIWQREAIERGAAEYDAKSGEWKWKAPAPPAPTDQGEQRQ